MKNTAIVQNFYAHLAKGDRENAYKLLADDFTLKQADSLPYGGGYRGPEALVDFFKKFNAYWQQFETLTTAFYECENKVFAVSTIQGKNVLDKLIETEMIQIYHVDNQKIVSAQPFYFDTALLLKR
ncbi:MAG: nuclear transport factor 2 family protein [Bacteroidota bacterium]